MLLISDIYADVLDISTFVVISVILFSVKVEVFAIKLRRVCN